MTRTLALDTEDNSKGKAYLWNFYDIDAETHHTFTSQLDAIDFITSLEDATIWACNLEYDLINTFRDFYAMLTYTFTGSRMLSASLGDDVIFYDTMNHWPISVREMGNRINLPKLEFAHEGNEKSSPKAIEYCRRDTEITGKFVKSMLQIYRNIGAKPKMTVASTTLDYFERNFYTQVKHSFTEKQIDFFHTGYYGGRTEIFHTKPIEGNIYYHDINSLYPHCLRSFLFPVLDHWRRTKNPDFSKHGMAEVEISAPKNLSIPYLPQKHEDKLLFPLGRWTGTYTYFEIREAISLGYRCERVKRAIEFPGAFNPFRGFIDDTYRKRLKAKEDGDILLSDTYKAFMNHCYGKFAQGNEVTKLTPLANHKLKAFDTIYFDMVLTTEKTRYPRYANCIWACYVTAYARHVLYQALCKVDRDPNARLLYCDTDSVLYESRNQTLGDSKNLGEFKLESKFSHAHFKLPKLYALTGNGVQTYKAKGIPHSARESFFNTGTAQFRKPYKLKETLRRNLSPKRKVKLIANYWELREKSIFSKYDKRISMKDGTTKPVFISS